MHITQEKILDLAKTHNLARMSLREIAKLVDSPTAQQVKHHLGYLEKRGLLKIDRVNHLVERVKRGMERSSNFVNVPILGSADCGPAKHFADERPEGFIKISKKVLPSAKGIFAVKAHGSSMNKAKIKGLNKIVKSVEDGDYVLVNSKFLQPSNGDYVLSVVDGCANIKKYFEDKKNGQIILMSESTHNYPPIYVHYNEAGECLVNGRVVDVIKSPK